MLSPRKLAPGQTTHPGPLVSFLLANTVVIDPDMVCRNTNLELAPFTGQNRSQQPILAGANEALSGMLKGFHITTNITNNSEHQYHDASLKPLRGIHPMEQKNFSIALWRKHSITDRVLFTMGRIKSSFVSPEQTVVPCATCLLSP